MEFCPGRIWAESSVNGPHPPTSTHSHFPYTNSTVDEYTVTCSSSVETPKDGTYNVLQDSHGKVLSVFFFPTKWKRKGKRYWSKHYLHSLFLNRLKGGEMAWCRPMRTGAGRCHQVRWKAYHGKAPGQFSSRRTPRDSASLCATSSSTHQSPPFTASRYADCFMVLFYSQDMTNIIVPSGQ